MIVNKVTIDDNKAIIEKNRDKLYIILSNNIVVMAKKNIKVKNINFIPYCAVYDNTEDAYKKWLHLIGKMCKKSSTSKYFKNPILDEHFVNGDGNINKDEYRDEIEALVSDI